MTKIEDIDKGLDHPFKTIDNARLILSSYPDAIFTWIPVNKQDYVLLKLDYKNSLDWCEYLDSIGTKIPMVLLSTDDGYNVVIGNTFKED